MDLDLERLTTQAARSRVESEGASELPGFKMEPKRRLWLALLLGVALSVAQYVLWSHVGDADAGDGVVSIAVAKKTIPPGSNLNENDFDFQDVVRQSLADSFVKQEEIASYKGRKLLLRVKKGEGLFKDVLYTDFQQKSLPERIPLGKRLYILKVDARDLAEVLRVDDHVDIVGHLSLPGIGESTQTLLENVTIVGINRDSEAEGRPGNALSFYVTPPEAEFLSFAEARAQFSIVLRNPNDNAKSKMGNGMTLNKFLEMPSIREVRDHDLFSIVKGRAKP